VTLASCLDKNVFWSFADNKYKFSLLLPENGKIKCIILIAFKWGEGLCLLDFINILTILI
jgi:hypothetical protein